MDTSILVDLHVFKYFHVEMLIEMFLSGFLIQVNTEFHFYAFLSSSSSLIKISILA